mmetsp:Transcript_3643/g.9228  ORF Transcript_3643/g.9228 Transcript_3643/m.9228 type:complete len:948 (+) Transcript_3643:107-2950(+)
MMSLDQWDWKVTAPEFVPASCSSSTGGTSIVQNGADGPRQSEPPGNPMGGPSPPPFPGMMNTMVGSSQPAPLQPSFAGPFSMQPAPIGSSARPPPPLPGGYGPLHFGPAPGSGPRPPQPMGPSPGQIHGPIGPCQPTRIAPEGGMGAFMVPMEPPQESSSLQTLRAQYEWQIHAKDQKLRDLQNRLSREEHDRVQMQSDFERDRHGLVRHLNQLVSAVERYGIQVETSNNVEDGRVSSLEGWMSASQGGSILPRQGTALDGKMEQLSGLLREGPSGDSATPTRWGDQEKPAGPLGASSLGLMHGSAARQDEVLSRPAGRNASACGTPGVDSKRGILSSFGDASTARGSRHPGSSEEGVDVAMPRSALRGGKQFDSMGLPDDSRTRRRATLQNASPNSRRSAARFERNPGSSEDGADAGAQRSALRGDKQMGSLADDSRSRKKATVSSATVQNASPNPRRTAEPWSATRLDRLCKQGGFGLKQVGDEAWVMKLQMCDLEPPLGDDGMQVFCRWLHQRVQRIKESKDIRSMRHVRAEVSFARNNLGDAAVGRLLTALQRTDLHVATLNLLGNCIGLAGLRHISDFLHEATSPVYEVHLGHNDIDDDAAIELVRATAEHPRYSARRGSEQQVQIWLRLNSNPIRDPGKLLWKLESQFGSNIGSVRNRHAATRCQAPVLISVEDSSHWVQDDKEQWQKNHDRGGPREKHSSEASNRYGQRRFDAPPGSARRDTGVSSSAAEGNRRSVAHQPRPYVVASKASTGASASGGKQVLSLPASGISSAIRKSADDAPSLLRPADGVVRLQSELAGRAHASQEETVEELPDAEVENKAPAGKEDGSDSAEPEVEAQSATGSAPSDGVDHQEALEEDMQPAEVEDRAASETSVGVEASCEHRNAPSTPLRGPPEETPEPDSVKREAQARLAVDEDEESSEPVQPVKLLAPPRILQRST